MFSLRYLKKTVATTLLKQHSRNKSLYHRGVKFFFKTNLLLTNSLTSGIFMVFGDLIQQEIEFEAHVTKYRFDWGRAGRMFVVGTVMGPLHHYYYLHLDKLLPKADMVTVIKKVFCDQIFASPATIICFYYGMGYLENKTIAESTDEIKLKFKYVYAGDCLYWPPVQIINFYYLPPHYRVVYINIATMVFNIFMSYMKHYDQH